MPANKSHHYVPRFYLQNFSLDERRRRIDLFNIKSGRVVEGASLKEQCARNYFYGKDRKIEDALAMIEGVAAQIIRAILQGAALPAPRTDEHAMLMMYVVVQHFRTVAGARLVDDFTDGFYKSVLRHYPGVTPEQLDSIRVRRDDPAAYAVSVAGECHRLATDLATKVLVAPEGSQFFTSDNPAIFYKGSLCSLCDLGRFAHPATTRLSKASPQQTPDASGTS